LLSADEPLKPSLYVMSEHEQYIKAKQAGRKAFWNGSPRKCPLKSGSSREAWLSAYDDEARRKNESDKRLARFNTGDRHALRHNYFCDVDI